MKIDVLVVGLGPAGACAARAAALAGANVIAVERNANPGLPVQCAEFVPLMIGMEMPEVFETQVQDVDHMLTYVEETSAHQTPDFRGHMIDRAKFDQLLIERARDAGAQCHFGTPFRGLDENGHALIGDGERIRANVIIGADGPRSPVARAIGVENSELVETRQVAVDIVEKHKATDIFLTAEIKGGYAWMFPKGDKCNLGLGVVREDKDQLKPLLDALHTRLVKEGRVGAEIHSHTGGLIPVGGITCLSKKQGDTQFFLTGDAAGLANPITGAGINAAVISGKLAGEAAGEIITSECEAAKLAVEDYADEIDALFGASLARAVKRRKELISAYDGGNSPTNKALERGWVAYPQYWNNLDLTDLELNPELDNESYEKPLARMSA